jgi:Ca2+-binding RTX toxin-like protein
MPRLLRAFLVLVFLCAALPAAAPPVYAQDASLAAITDGIQSYATTVLNSLGNFEELGQAVPFTALSPSGKDALNLDHLMGDLFAKLPPDYVSDADLRSALENLSTVDPGGVAVTVSGASVTRSGNFIDVRFTLAAARVVNVPLSFAQDPVALAGSDLAIKFSLTTAPSFRFDTTQPAPELALYLTSPPVVNVKMETDGALTMTPFESLLGFADLTVDGRYALNLGVTVALKDPDGPGGDETITLDEWTTTALGDLVTVGFTDQPGADIQATVDLHTPLTGADPDGTISWVVQDAAAGLGAPTVALNVLNDFTHIDAADMLSGLGQLATAIISAQSTRDLDLPFLQEGMKKAVDFAQPLLDFLKQQGEAAIICGRKDGDPPTGGYWNAAAGDKLWCQAIMLQNPAAVKWKVEGGEVKVNPDLNTAGLDPTATVPVTLGANAIDGVRLEFWLPGEPAGGPAPHAVTPLFLTVQDLADKLAVLGGFDKDVLAPAYDPDTHSLTYRLQKTLKGNELPPVAATFDFGDQLKGKTGLIGLNPAATASVAIDGSALAFDVTFGAILVADVNDIVTGGSVADRFFMKVRSGAGEHEFSADASVNVTNVELGGKLAFLEVKATGDSSAPGVPLGTVFTLGPADHTKPMIAVDVKGGTIDVAGSPPFKIDDAIRLRTLINDLVANTTVACNVGMAAGLRVAASMGNPPIEIATGKVGVSWPTVFKEGCVPDPATLDIRTDANFEDALKAFDIDPNNSVALLGTILNAVDALAGGIEAVSGEGASILDTLDLPLVGMKPRALLDNLSSLQTALDDLRRNPAASLQKLEGELEKALADALGVASDPNMVTLALADAPGSDPKVKDLLIGLDFGYGQTLDKQMVLDLGDGLSDLAGLAANGSFQVKYDVHAGLHLAIPLAKDFDEDAILVLDTTGILGTLDVEAPKVGMEANVGPLTLELDGVAKVGASLKVGRDNNGTAGDESFPLASYFGGVTAVVGGPAEAKECGILDEAADPQVPLTGDACAKLKLTLDGIPIAGTLGFIAGEIETPDIWQVHVPANLGDKITAAVLDWSLLLKALPELMAKAESAMRSGDKVPLVGSYLDGGADLVDKIDKQLVVPLANLAGQLKGLEPVAIQSTIHSEVFRVVGGAGILRDTDGNGTPGEASDVIVTLICGNDKHPCAAGDRTTSIQDARVTMLLGDSADAEVPFDLGLPGLPLSITGNVKATVPWTLLADFGLSRSQGPYIVTGGAGHGNAPEFELKPEVTLGDTPDACYVGDLPDTLKGKFSASRCITGKLGFLAVNLHDGNDMGGSTQTEDKGDDQTSLSLTTTLDLTAAGDRLTLGVLLAGGAGIKLDVRAQANVDLLIRTGINTGESASLPSVVGAFHLTWDIPGGGGPSEIVFDNLYLDAGKWVSDFMGPIVNQIKDITSPLKPIIDTIRSPIPVISDLAEMVGEPPVTMIEILKKAAGGYDLSLVESVLAFLNFVNTLPVDQANLFIPLGIVSGGGWTPGRFVIVGAVAQGAPLTPDQAGSLIGESNAGDDLLGRLGGGAVAGVHQGIVGASVDTGAFGVPGLSFPFMNSASNIFMLLMGKDVTLVRWDAGSLRASAGVSYSFGPIMVGPVPITIGISGSIAVEGHFAMGYDTSGLRKALTAGGSAVDLFDGIFIDDLDASGLDVPEIRLNGTVAVNAGVDAVVVAAGVEGGIRLTVDLNLNDSPTPDGKLRIDEIRKHLQNPICMFDMSGSLDAFLAIWARVGFQLFERTFRLEIVNVRLLDFSFSCDPQQTVPLPANLADVVDGVLWLNMGVRASLRHIQDAEKNEKFVVRQLTSAPPYRFSIIAFGAYEEETANSVAANAGDGDDEISLEASTDANNNIIPFTAQAVLDGGTGNDRLRSGDGNDSLTGGPEDPAGDQPDNDKINGGAGDDTLNGGYGQDVLSGEIGNDTINGGRGNDTLMGGPGADIMDGGADDDELTGGPGTVPYRDLGDTLRGGAGNDQVDGNQGDDWLYGDETLACGAEGANTGGIDLVIGGEGDDHLFGGYNNDVLAGESGNDELCGNAGDDILDGDDDNAATPDGNDAINGGSGVDTAYGRGGDDDITGKAGNDTLYGGDDNDDISGGADTDTLYGGAGRDYLFGDDGSAVRPAGQADATSMNFSESTGAPDSLWGGDGNDVMYGEGARDEMNGEAGNDTMYGNDGNDLLRGGGDNDTMYGNAGPDELYGDSGDDKMYGDAGNDVVRGGMGDDHAEGNENADTLYGDAGQDDLIGGSSTAGTPDDDDVLFGNTGQDVMAGDNASITRPGGAEPDGTIVRVVILHDLASGNTNTGVAGNDTLNGDEGNDDLYGGGETDTLHGDAGDDYAEGNGGDDWLYGDAGQDDLIGGTSRGGGGVPDGADHLWGGSDGPVLTSDFDVLAGDNARVERLTSGGQWIRHTYRPSDAVDVVLRRVTLYDVATTGFTPATGVSAGDELYGETGFDILYGQGGNDLVRGGSGDDSAFGNASDDRIYGDGGQDDLVGGTGRTISDDPNTASDGRLDGADTIYGGDGELALPLAASASSGAGVQVVANGFRLFLALVMNRATSQPIVPDAAGDFDAILGDNGTIERDLDGAGLWAVNTFNAAHKRVMRLYDVGTAGNPAGAGTAGGDSLYGEADDDMMYGQGGADTLQGNAGADYMEGNAGADTMNGNAGNDDMVGGTGRINLDGPDGVNGRLDAGDVLYGGSGFDVMAGDNAMIARTLVGGQWVSNIYNGGIQHKPRILLDIDSPNTTLVSGGDLMYGEGDDDLMYGQGGVDALWGGDGQDFMEGNAEGDTLHGEAGQDDMIGGTVQAGVTDGDDTMTGDGEADVMLGDNGAITRPVDASTHWIPDPNTHDFIRNVVLFDVETAGSPVSQSFSGDDNMSGNAEQDIMFGQGGNDTLDGGDDFDIMEGNHGADTLYGGAGEDDLAGGGSANDGVIDAGRVGDGLLDGADVMYGGDDGDVMTGDNARIDRQVGGNGLWSVDPNVNDVFRSITLFDIERAGGPAINPATSGSDLMYGDAGRDLMFGQGNDAIDHDGDGRYNEDPPDGVDNDRDGRESAGSVGYDCLDGTDNDGDGLADAADPQCRAKIDEDGGGDQMVGGAGDDVMEGNFGSDWMFGDSGEDDMLGGSSANAAGLIGAGVPPTGLLDGDDVMNGGADDDVMLADNGLIQRQTDANRTWLWHNGFGFDMVVRVASVPGTPEAAGAFGHDFMRGDAGEDEVYGEQGNDYMEGNAGEDAMVGDLGLITSQVEDGSRQRIITVNGPFFEETVYVAGTFTRQVALYSFLKGGGAEGNDTMLGGDGRDSMHGGPGNDMMNGNGDVDKLFGGDGDDVVWGGPGDDDLWGGYQDDNLDVRPRVASALHPADPPEWFTYGAPDNYQGLDLIYGGWDRDALQANVAAPGPRVTDRLIDWAGGFNVFYVCTGAYGEGTITRSGSPSLEAFLQNLSAADGAVNTRTAGSSGFRELAYVFANERGQNSHPPHPDHPGHFTCDDGSIYVPSKSQTLGVSDLALWAGARDIVNGQATVKDDLGATFPGATVSLIWSLPDGTSVEQTTITDAKGLAKFVVTGQKGAHQALISEVAVGPTAIDADASIWLKTITIK